VQLQKERECYGVSWGISSPDDYSSRAIFIRLFSCEFHRSYGLPDTVWACINPGSEKSLLTEIHPDSGEPDADQIVQKNLQQ
jgi:hypothetical protein